MVIPDSIMPCLMLNKKIKTSEELKQNSNSYSGEMKTINSMKFNYTVIPQISFPVEKATFSMLS